MATVTDAADAQAVTEIVKLPVGSSDQWALLAFVQQWYETVFPQLPGFKQATVHTPQVGTLIIEVQWASREASEASGRDLRLSSYFAGLQSWLVGWPDVSLKTDRIESPVPMANVSAAF